MNLKRKLNLLEKLKEERDTKASKKKEMKSNKNLDWELKKDGLVIQL